MRTISFNINERDLKELRELVKDGEYPNVSEAIRFAVKDLLKYHKTRVPVELSERKRSH